MLSYLHPIICVMRIVVLLYNTNIKEHVLLYVPLALMLILPMLIVWLVMPSV